MPTGRYCMDDDADAAQFHGHPPRVVAEGQAGWDRVLRRAAWLRCGMNVSYRITTEGC
jgi:hypothetical protein